MAPITGWMPLRRLRAEQAHPATLHGPEVPLPALGTALARASAAALLEPATGPPRRFSCSPRPRSPERRLPRSWSPPEARRAVSRVQVAQPRLMPGQQPSAPQQTPTPSAGSSAEVSADAVSGE